MHDLFALLEEINLNPNYQATLRYNTDFHGGLSVDVLYNGTNIFHKPIDDLKAVPIITQLLQAEMKKCTEYRVYYHDQYISIDKKYSNLIDANVAACEFFEKYNVKCDVERIG